MKDYFKLMSELALIKQSLLSIERNTSAIGGWLPKRFVLKYFDYGENQLRSFERTNEVVVSKIGRRKFYSVESLVNILNKNSIK